MAFTSCDALCHLPHVYTTCVQLMNLTLSFKSLVMTLLVIQDTIFNIFLNGSAADENGEPPQSLNSIEADINKLSP